MGKKKRVLATFMVLLALAVGFYFIASAISKTTGYVVSEISNSNVEAYVFTSKNCVGCKSGIDLMKESEIKYNQYDAMENTANKILFSKFLRAYNIEEVEFPIIFIGEKVFIGWNPEIQSSLGEEIAYCKLNICENPAEKLN